MKGKFKFDLQRFANNDIMTWEDQGTQGLTNRQITFYNRTLLSRLLPALIFMEHGQKKPIPKKSGMTANFRRFHKLEPSLEPLVEGVTPSGNKIKISAIHAMVKQYGDFVVHSDLIDMIGIDPHVTETLQLLGEQSAETLDILVRDVIAAGTNVFYVGGGTAINQVTAADVIDAAVLRRVRQIMARNNVKPQAGKHFIAFIHPDISHDIMGDDAWEKAQNYNKTGNIFEGELGRMYGTRFIESTMCPIYPGAGAGGEDIYGTIIIGKDAYGVPDIAGSSKPESIIKPLGSGGTSDPLNQRGSVGWKAMMTTIRLEELAILQLYSACSIE